MPEALDMSRGLSDESLDELAFGVEAGFEARGWDIAATLLTVIDPVTLSFEMRGRGIDFDEADGDIVLAAAPVKTLDGYPHSALIGESVPEWALGVVLVTEMWTYPSDVNAEMREITRPDDYDNPGEKRACVCVMRDGRVRWVERERGGEVSLKAWGPEDDHLVETLQRVLGQATAPTEEPVARLAGRLWLEGAVSHCKRAFQEGDVVTWDGESLLVEGTAVTVDPHDEEFQSLLRAGWEGLRQSAVAGYVKGIEPHEAAWMDEGMFARTVLRGTREESELLNALEIVTDEEVARQVGARLREVGWLWEDRH